MTDRDQTILWLTDWLGDTELTADQYVRLATAAEQIEDLYTADEEAESQEALTVALQWILGETTPAAVSDRLLRVRIETAKAMTAVHQVARMMAAEGATEVAIGEALGVARLTVRRALGK